MTNFHCSAKDSPSSPYGCTLLTLPWNLAQGSDNGQLAADKGHANCTFFLLRWKHSAKRLYRVYLLLPQYLASLLDIIHLLSL